LRDLQGFADTLTVMAPASACRRLAAVKSLLSFGHRTGLLPANVGAALRLPKVPNLVSERIMDEEQAQSLLTGSDNHRDSVIVRLLYGSAIRASELCDLNWRNCQRRGETGQITVVGKGTKARSIVLSKETWEALETLRTGSDGPVFLSTRGNPLTEPALWRIVRRTAKSAGVDLPISPHWLRHAHASHALDRGAPIHLVQATLGHASIATTGRYLHARPGESSSKYVPA
jgi:integrase/recombinase XerD